MTGVDGISTGRVPLPDGLDAAGAGVWSRAFLPPFLLACLLPLFLYLCHSCFVSLLLASSLLSFFLSLLPSYPLFQFPPHFLCFLSLRFGRPAQVQYLDRLFDYFMSGPTRDVVERTWQCPQMVVNASSWAFTHNVAYCLVSVFPGGEPLFFRSLQSPGTKQCSNLNGAQLATEPLHWPERFPKCAPNQCRGGTRQMDGLCLRVSRDGTEVGPGLRRLDGHQQATRQGTVLG